MSDFGHTYQDEPVPECDCQRCAIATRDALRAEVEVLREAAQEFIRDYIEGDMGDIKSYVRAFSAALRPPR